MKILDFNEMESVNGGAGTRISSMSSISRTSSARRTGFSNRDISCGLLAIGAIAAFSFSWGVGVGLGGAWVQNECWHY